MYLIALLNIKISIGFLPEMTNRSLIIGKLPLIILCMIENALLDSILDTILEQIEQPWRVPQDDHRINPLRGLLKKFKWGNLQKDKVDNIDEWAALRWKNKMIKK
jgi:hypothetical protein